MLLLLLLLVLLVFNGIANAATINAPVFGAMVVASVIGYLILLWPPLSRLSTINYIDYGV
jgi:hypothetical protein